MADLAVIAIICGLAYLFGYLSNFSLYKAHVISHSSFLFNTSVSSLLFFSAVNCMSVAGFIIVDTEMKHNWK